jgi:hypothetical protein
MSDAKIEVKVGEISFHGEGSQEWLEKQLDKIIGKAETLIKLSQIHSPPGKELGATKISTYLGNLAQFLKKNSATKPFDIFLATAIWLTRKGQDRLTSKNVSDALRDAKQKKLSNPAAFLKQNTKKGRCEMDGKQFFVTEKALAKYS